MKVMGLWTLEIIIRIVSFFEALLVTPPAIDFGTGVSPFPLFSILQVRPTCWPFGYRIKSPELTYQSMLLPWSPTHVRINELYNVTITCMEQLVELYGQDEVCIIDVFTSCLHVDKTPTVF